jgi:hypothetical protein
MVITWALRRDVYRPFGEGGCEEEGYGVAEVGRAVPRSRNEFADALRTQEGAAESAYVGSGDVRSVMHNGDID